MRGISRRQFAVGGIAAASLASLGAKAFSPAESAAAPAAPAVTVTVGQAAVAEIIPAAIVGGNERWPQNELEAWDEAAQAPVAPLGELSREIRLRQLRYPGGTVANLFDWKKAIGPQAQRSLQVGGGFVGGAQPYDSVFGPDEQQKFAKALGADTLIMTPSVVSTPQDAADWVEYMNSPPGAHRGGGTDWAAVRAANGHPAPYGIVWWEIGNEPYGPNQRYWRSADEATALQQYIFGGTLTQTAQRVGTPSDHRPGAAVSSGAASQRFTVWYPPVVPGSQTIRVGGTAWTAVTDLSAAGAADQVYSFDPATGAITFGDGTHGMIPPLGATIDADYESGPHAGFVDYYKAMKAVDPSIKVSSSWATPAFVQLMGTVHSYDALGPHLYATPDVSGTVAQIHDRLMPAVDTVVGSLTALISAVDQYAPAGRKPVIEVGEYGTTTQQSGPVGWNGSMSHALYLAGVVDGMILNNVKLACNSNFNEAAPATGQLFGGAPDFYLTARARLLGLYSRLAGSQPVQTTVAGNPALAGGTYQALRVLAVRDPGDGTVRLVLTNRDPQNPVAANVHVGQLRGSHAVAITTLNAASLDSYNTAADDTAVDTTSTTSRATLPDLSLTLPAHSVTVVEIGR